MIIRPDVITRIKVNDTLTFGDSIATCNSNIYSAAEKILPTLTLEPPGPLIDSAAPHSAIRIMFIDFDQF